MTRITIKKLRDKWWNQRNGFVHGATRHNDQLDTLRNRLFNWKTMKLSIERLAKAEQLEECAADLDKLSSREVR